MLIKSFSMFLGKWCLVLTAFAILSFSAAAQTTVSTAQSTSPGTAPPGFAWWHFALTVIGTICCASIFWWRRDKNKEQTVATRNGKNVSGVKFEKEIATAESFDAGSDFRRESLDVPSWMTQTINGQNGNGAKKSIEIPTFDSLEMPAVIEELPVSDDPVLLESIAKLQDTSADEEERENAIAVLSGFITQNSVDVLSEVAKTDESSRLRIGALNALGSFNHESVFEPILLACAHNSREIKAAAARILSRLTIDRAEALSRIIRSGDDQRLQQAAAACVDAGMVNHAFDRLMHPDRSQARNAFAVINLLVSAGEFKPIISSISFPSDIHVRLATIEALRTLAPVKMLPSLYELTAKDNLAGEVREELEKLVAELTELTIS